MNTQYPIDDEALRTALRAFKTKHSLTWKQLHANADIELKYESFISWLKGKSRKIDYVYGLKLVEMMQSIEII